MSDFVEEEKDLLAASLMFAHLNRQQFYEYIDRQGHMHTSRYLEHTCDVNELRQKLTAPSPEIANKKTQEITERPELYQHPSKYTILDVLLDRITNQKAK